MNDENKGHIYHLLQKAESDALGDYVWDTE